MRISKIPFLIQSLFSRYFEFRIRTKDKVIYLTFDDGPVPEITERVLEILSRHNAKATFFCVGDNIRKHPECFKRVISEGHSVGNHTMHHLQGITTEYNRYLDDIAECASYCPSKLFRPPYGRLWFKQIKTLKRQGYRLVLWTVISYDYNRSLSPEECIKNSLKLRSGDIILFHDNPKAEKNMFPCLETVLNYYGSQGFEFRAIV